MLGRMHYAVPWIQTDRDTHIYVYPTNPTRPRLQHALLTDSVLASKADLEALLKLLKTKLEEAKRVSWEVPYGGYRLTLSVSSLLRRKID